MQNACRHGRLARVRRCSNRKLLHTILIFCPFFRPRWCLGITAAQGAAARLGVSLTHRASARRLQYVTGHCADGHLPDDIHWPSIADPAATTVVYMPKNTMHAFVRTALDAGLDPATPALAVTDATRPGEASMAATVAELPARLDALQPRGATLVMIGRTMAPEGRGEARAPAQPTGMTLTATEMRCPPEASTTPSIGATSA